MFPLVLGDCLNGRYCKPTARRGTADRVTEGTEHLLALQFLGIPFEFRFLHARIQYLCTWKLIKRKNVGIF